MSKTEIIRSRIDYGLRKLIDKVILIKGFKGDSDFIEEAINYYITSLNLTEEELYNEIKNYKRKISLSKQIKHTKEKTRYFYLIRNFYNTVFKLNQSFVFNSNKPNMNIISKIIDEYVKLYDDFPEDIKEDLKEEIDNIIKLKDELIFSDKISLIGLSNMVEENKKQKDSLTRKINS